MVRRGQTRRLQPLQDSTLREYSARSDGYVHFFLDRKEGGDPIPLRVDQVSVDLYWMAPDRAKQVVRAQRLEKLMPIRDFYYYIDRLTVIQNGFGNEIQVGEGKDVRGVLHPLTLNAQSFYDYRLADSVTLTLQGYPEPIRVYEVEVRPKDMGKPGYVGAVFLDAATASIVRLVFSFTPAAYVDRRNDQVHITLEHGLWDYKFWLPYRQMVEVRREVPEFDFGVQSVIRAELTVGEYDFDPQLSAALFGGRPVTYSPNWAQDTTRFQGGLYDGMQDAGLSLPEAGMPTAEELEAEARRLVRERYLGGLPRIRPFAGGASSVVRSNRVEGVFVGAGLSYRLSTSSAVRAQGGYAFGPGQGSVILSADGGGEEGTGTWGGALYWNEMRDLGPLPGASGAVNTLSTLTAGDDFTDPFFAQGGRLWRRWSPKGGGHVRLEAEMEWHSAPAATWSQSPLREDRVFRTLLAAEEGTRITTRAEYDRGGIAIAGWTGRTRAVLEGGAWRGDSFGRAVGSLAALRVSSDRVTRGRLTLDLGLAGGALPPQHLFVLGGRHLVPGHAYRGFAGTRVVRLSGWVARTVVPGWLGVRAFGAAAATGGLDGHRPDGWSVRETDAVEGGVGVGLEVLHGLFRVDLGFGLGRRGDSELILSVNESLWSFL